MPGVVIVPYSPDWPVIFSGLSQELQDFFAPARVAVEHIGSTAVPGLAAKPVIDMLLGADTLSAIESRIPALSTQGYLYVPKYEQELPMRRYFVKTASLRVHLHAVEIGGRLWTDHLKFRDALRTDAALRLHYQALKLRLASVFADDKPAYTAAKEPFITAVLRHGA